MKTLHWPRLSAVVCSSLLVAASLGFAGDSVPGGPGPDPVPAPPPAIAVSLTLPGYTLWIDMMPTPVPDNPAIGLQRVGDFGSFPAVFKLVNRSGSPLQLELVGQAGTLKPVLFVMRNAAGREIWRSYKPDPRILAPAVLRTVTLDDGKSWRIAANVPMGIKGRPLKAGRYTLEAFVNGSPRYAATAPFEISYAY